MGISHFCIDDKGIKVENPQHFTKNQSKIARLQRLLSKKVKGSRRYNKCKLKIARLHQKIKNQREHFLHNISSSLVTNYDKIFVEDLDIKKLLEQKKMSKHISDVSWSKFFEMLNYKCDWYGKELVKVDRFFPSSKTCSCCGCVKKELKLSQRVYKCENCGFELDRDHNAALNIMAFGVQNA